MKSFLSLIVCLGLLATATAHAAPLTTFEMMMNDVKTGTIFEQYSNDERCPKAIQLTEIESTTGYGVPGSTNILLSTARDRSDAGGFAHEGNIIVFVPGLKPGHSHTLARKLTFPMGVAYGTLSQSDRNGMIGSTWETTAISLAALGKYRFTITYDSKAKIVTYQASGGAVTDTNCMFINNPPSQK